MDRLAGFSKNQYSVAIVADSIGPNEARLTSVLATFPRFILPEVATHRRQSLLSMNSASSRAIPVEKRIEEVMAFPVVPLHFGRRQRGMAADEELTDTDREAAASLWLAARDAAVERARDAPSPPVPIGVNFGATPPVSRP